MIKVGIVLNYKNAEKKKDELLNVNSRKMKWLSLANEARYKKFCIIKIAENSPFEIKKNTIFKF